MEGEDMTIQPGMRIEAKAQHRAATPLRAMPHARGKHAPPRFPADLVAIERWQSWLDAIALHEVCIVRAPTGYGKTAFAATLLAHAGSAGWSVGWVSFDLDDNEPATVGHLFEAVRLARGAPAEDSLAALSSAPSSAATLAGALADRIEACEQPLLLVLDDVDRLTDPRTIDVLNRLLRHSPSPLRLLLSSRAASALAIGDVERRGMALSIGCSELRLADDEVTQFLQAADASTNPRGGENVNHLLEGWPAGVRLARQSKALPALIDRIAHQLAPMLDALPNTGRQFLQRCAVAPQFNAELCQLLSGEKDSGALLDDPAARGLFIEALADRSEWYRLHPAFRAVLQRPLASDTDALPQLHRVAARYFAGQHMIAEAAEQAALAGDAEQAADQLAAIILPIIEQGELARAATWMARLPATQIAARPALVQAQAWLQTLLAAPDANAAITRLKATGAVDEARAVDLVHHAYRDDKFTDAAELCDQLLAAPDGLSDFAIAMVRTVLAHGALKRGLFGLVHDALRPLMLRSMGPSLGLPQALAICARSALSRAQGQLADAERVLRDGLPDASEPNLASALIEAGLARCCYERDDMATAAELAARALPLLEHSPFQDAQIAAFHVAIRATANMGRTERAASLIDRAELVAFGRDWAPLKAMCIVERARLRLPQTIDPEAVVAMADEEAAVLDPLSAAGRSFALLSEVRAYEAIASGDRARLTTVAERLLRLASNADDAELRATATLLNILPQLSGRCDKMVELETVRFLNHAASSGFRRTIVDVLDVTGVRAVQNFCSEAYSSGSFLALLKLAEPSRRNPALEGSHGAAPGEAFSFLTEREIEILSSLNAGDSNKEIARTLQLAPETIKWHLKNVMRKLRANSREEAVKNASTLGLKLIEVIPRG
jgi:LuxR family maltose regulon positive regulatory protein